MMQGFQNFCIVVVGMIVLWAEFLLFRESFTSKILGNMAAGMMLVATILGSAKDLKR